MHHPASTVFSSGQWGTSLALALSHGTNDAQKTMGIIAMAMVTTGYVTEFHVPWWVIALSAGAIALGTAAGGWRLIKTLGGKFYKIRPVHAFGSQLTSAMHHPGGGAAGRAGQHHAGGQFGDHGRWLGRPAVQGALDGGPRHRRGLAADHPGRGLAGRRHSICIVDLLCLRRMDSWDSKSSSSRRQDKFLQSLIQHRRKSRWTGMDALEAYMKKRSEKHATVGAPGRKGCRRGAGAS